MEKAKRRKLPNVYEKHHIIPRSLGGPNTNENKALLTPREHFIAHSLLLKMVIEPKHRRSMSYAFVAMGRSHNKTGYTRIGNGRLYEKIKISIRDEFSGTNNPFYGDHRFKGENNPFYGETHTEESLKKMRNRRLFGEANSFWKHTHTQDTKDKLSKYRSHRTKIIFIDGKEISLSRKIDIGSYLGVSTALGVQLCSIKKHLWHKYNIKEIICE